MTNTITLKRTINEFNFASPNWDKLPPDIYDISEEGLSKQEVHLLGAMKLAYYSLEKGRNKVIQTATKTSVITIIALVIGLIGLISLSSLSTNEKLAKPVSAATVSAQLRSGSLKVGEIIESTVSGVLKHTNNF